LEPLPRSDPVPVAVNSATIIRAIPVPVASPDTNPVPVVLDDPKLLPAPNPIPVAADGVAVVRAPPAPIASPHSKLITRGKGDFHLAFTCLAVPFLGDAFLLGALLTGTFLLCALLTATFF